MNQTTPSTALDVLHHQHAEGGSGHSGTVFVTQWNAPGWDVGLTACSVVSTVCRKCIDVTPHTTNFDNHTLISTPGAFKFLITALA